MAQADASQKTYRLSDDPSFLTNQEKNHIYRVQHKRAYKLCDPVVKPYVDCTKHRLISLLWACRDEKAQMADCLHEVAERAREEVTEEYLRQRQAKRAAEDAALSKETAASS